MTLLRSIKKGTIHEFDSKTAANILSIPQSGWELAEENEIPIDDFTQIDGLNSAQIKKLNKKGILNYPQLLSICDKDKADIGITDGMLEKVKELIKL